MRELVHLVLVVALLSQGMAGAVPAAASEPAEQAMPCHGDEPMPADCCDGEACQCLALCGAPIGVPVAGITAAQPAFAAPTLTATSAGPRSAHRLTPLRPPIPSA